MNTYMLTNWITQKKLKNSGNIEENIVGKLLDRVLAMIFLDMTPKASIDKWDYIKLKNFCITKETIKKMRRQPTE